MNKIFISKKFISKKSDSANEIKYEITTNWHGKKYGILAVITDKNKIQMALQEAIKEMVITIRMLETFGENVLEDMRNPYSSINMKKPLKKIKTEIIYE